MPTLPIVSVLNDEFERTEALGAFETRDGRAFARSGHSTGRAMHLVIVNWDLLRDEQMLPAALLEAYVGCKINHRRWPVALIEKTFRKCAEECGISQLRELGEPIPPNALHRVYRGVAGKFGRARGLSWTSSLDVACHFASHFSEPWGPPAVYQASFQESDVFCYTDRRFEAEFIGRPARVRRLKLTKREMVERAARHLVALRQKEQRVWQSQCAGA